VIGSKTGSWGEDAAARHARSLGAKVVGRNVRGPRGELDLVLRHRGVLIFGEVKTRRSDRFGSGLEAVTPAKQASIARTALHYMIQRGIDPGRVRCRFDVFLVTPGPRVVWIEAAFDSCV
jgi:putative endonuclease